MTAPPREIRNPRTGQTMIFRQTAADTAGALLQIECFSAPNGPREPVHSHPRQESRFELLSGRLWFEIDGQGRIAGPGDIVFIPARSLHCFWNEGDEVAHYLQEFRPALEAEHFFETLFGLAQDGHINDNGNPSLLGLSLLVPAMGNVLRPTSPPWPLLRGLSLALRPFARLRGYPARYPRAARVRTGSLADRETLRTQILAAQTGFHSAINGLTDSDLSNPTRNPAWTVGAILVHLVSSLEMVPREVEHARRYKGMYNMPRFIRDRGNAILTRRAARGQTVDSLRRRYDAAVTSALATLDAVPDDEFGRGADFWGEGFRDVASLFAAAGEHLSEHGPDLDGVRVARTSAANVS